MKKAAMIIILTLLLALQVSARENGEIRLRLCHGGMPISGAQVTLYRVGTHNAAGQLVLDAPFSGAVEERDGPLASLLWKYARTAEIPGLDATTDEQGMALFDDLEPGVYLLGQKGPAAGFQAFLPFFVELPMKAGESTLWTVEVKPKTAPEESPKTGDDLETAYPLTQLIFVGCAPRKKRR